jgi:hypothetical protein
MLFFVELTDHSITHRLGEASAIAQLLIGVSGAAIWQPRTSHTTRISIDIVDALHSSIRGISSRNRAVQSMLVRKL